MVQNKEVDTASTEIGRLRGRLEQLQQEQSGLQQRMEELEKENREFATQCVQIQEQNQAITNVYVASHRLHATLDPPGVMKMIMEILIELVGAEEFGILLLDEKKSTLNLVAGEGVRERLPSESLPAGEGVVGEVSASGEPFFFTPKSAREEEVGLPLAAIPLNVEDQPVGVIVIYKLLSHKSSFSEVDHQLLQLLAAHAATALVSARLHSSLDRKVKTMEGFLQLMKSQ